MAEIDFVLLWKEHYDKIDQSLAINKYLLKEITTQKAVSAMRALIREKAAGIIAAIIYLVLLGGVLFFAITHYSPAANYFIISMGCIFLINIKALFDYIRHLVWANNIDYNGSIMDIQQQLTRLQLSIWQHSRIMVLQFPFWTTFCLSSKWFPHSVGWGYIVFQLVLTSSFIYLAWWLYTHLVPEKAGSKLVQIFINGAGGKKVMKALAFYREMEQFENSSQP